MSIGSSPVADAIAVVEERPERASMRAIGASSAVAAGLATLLNVVAGRALGVDGYADFLVIWGLFFTFTGVLPGLQQEVTRSVATARVQALHSHRPVAGTLVIGAGGVVAILATTPLWASTVPDDVLGVSSVLALGFLCYAWANHVNGTLAATHRWSLYAAAILLDGVLRFLLVGAVLVLDTGPVGFAVGLVGASSTWAVLAMNADVRASTMAAGDAGTSVFVRRSAHAMLASGCSALIVAGFPVLLKLFAGDVKDGADAGIVLAVLMATRAPLLLFLNAYQGVLITRLVDSGAPVRLMVRWIRVGLVFSIPAAGAAYLVGPHLLRLVFGPGYDATGGLFVGLVAAGVALGIITLAGWTTLAHRLHAIFVWGWLTAVATTSALLTVPLDLDLRVSLALIVGPLLGACVHLLALHRLMLRAGKAPDAHSTGFEPR
jgi:O-antigen/teichoic acid export membrane protein